VEDEGDSRGRGRGERRRRYGEGRGTRGETHKAAYVSSVMRTGDFSFRARECKRKMKARSFFSQGVSVYGCHRRGCRRWRRHHQKIFFRLISRVRDQRSSGNLVYKAKSDHELLIYIVNIVKNHLFRKCKVLYIFFSYAFDARISCFILYCRRLIY